jgi:hypothetical protein
LLLKHNFLHEVMSVITHTHPYRLSALWRRTVIIEYNDKLCSLSGSTRLIYVTKLNFWKKLLKYVDKSLTFTWIYIQLRIWEHVHSACLVKSDRQVWTLGRYQKHNKKVHKQRPHKCIPITTPLLHIFQQTQL